MEERNEKDDRLSGDVKIETPFTKRLENYWYHYKWHTIVAVFLLVVFLVVGLQMCKKESYDTYVLYAGDKEISRNSKDGEIPLYNTVLSSLGKAAGDYNGDGEVVVSLTTLLALTNEQIKDAEGDPELQGNDWGPWDPEKYTVEDAAFGFVVMENGATINLESSWAINMLDPREAITAFCGTLAGADMYGPGNALRINGVKHNAKYTFTPDLKSAGAAFYEGVGNESPADREARLWIDAIINDTDPLVLPEQALCVTKILEGIYTSAKTGEIFRF